MRHDSADTADGTQPSEPSWTFADPLAGISSGEQRRWSSSGTSHGTGTGEARPTAPNPETVRTVLNDVFAPAAERTTAEDDVTTDADIDTAESAAAVTEDMASEDDGVPDDGVPVDGEPVDGGPDDGGSGGEGAPVTPVERSSPQTRPGMLPTQRRTWPTRRRLTRQAWRPRGRTRARRRAASSQQPTSLKPTRGFAGVTVAILLLLLLCVVAAQLVISFIGMFTG